MPNPCRSACNGNPNSPQCNSKTTVIVGASIGICVAVIFFVLIFLIRRRRNLKNCNFPHKQTSASFSNNMHPDIEATSNDSGYAEIPLENIDSIKNEDNVYQTIDLLKEQETVIADEYNHLSGKVRPSTNTSYSHLAGYFPSEHAVSKLEKNPNGDLQLKTNENDTSYDMIGKTKLETTVHPNVPESTYNHTETEINQHGTLKRDFDNYSHLHVLTKTNSWCNTEHDEAVISNQSLVHKKTGFCLKDDDVESKSMEQTHETETRTGVKLSETSKLSLPENDEDVDHQYFTLEKVAI